MLVAAATGAAATPSAAAEAGLLGRAVRREHRELLAHVRRAAIGAVGRLADADELLEMRLALHADELVDRHRLQSSETARGTHRQAGAARGAALRAARARRGGPGALAADVGGRLPAGHLPRLVRRVARGADRVRDRRRGDGRPRRELELPLARARAPARRDRPHLARPLAL